MKEFIRICSPVLFLACWKTLGRNNPFNGNDNRHTFGISYRANMKTQNWKAKLKVTLKFNFGLGIEQL